MDFLLRSGATWTVPAVTVCEYQDTFRTIAVVCELNKARLWLVSNPARRKTPKGMPRFLNGWLARAAGTVEAPKTPRIWACPHDPRCVARWHCEKRQDFDRTAQRVTVTQAERALVEAEMKRIGVLA